jgi:Uri superfamily endonuclease
MKKVYNKAYYNIKRETSQYNKFMKWHVQYYHDNMELLSSEWFKTQREAIANVEKSKWTGARGFPIGNHMSYTEYTERGES